MQDCSNTQCRLVCYKRGVSKLVSRVDVEVEEARQSVAAVTAPSWLHHCVDFTAQPRVEFIPAQIEASKSGWRQAAGRI